MPGKPKPGEIVVLVVMMAIALTATLGGCSCSPRGYEPYFLEVTYVITDLDEEIGRDIDILKGGDVTYNNPQGGMEQDVCYTFPCKYTFTFKRGDAVVLIVQARNDTRSPICKILVDGREWRRSESHGEYSVATCSGRLGGP